MNTKRQIIETFNVKIAKENLKQKDIAKRIGISEDRLSRILSLKSNMHADEMILLCAALDIDPNDFRKSA